MRNIHFIYMLFLMTILHSLIYAQHPQLHSILSGENHAFSPNPSIMSPHTPVPAAYTASESQKNTPFIFHETKTTPQPTRTKTIIAHEETPEIKARTMATEDSSMTLAQQRQVMIDELNKNAKFLEAQGKVLKLVSKLVRPSVVHLESVSHINSGTPGRVIKAEESGSGIIIHRANRYYVLTNRHVIRNATPGNIRIKLYDNRIINPLMVRYDDETDIAILLLNVSDVIPASIGDSSALDIGDFVLAVGSPFGLSHSVTFGIISAKGRRDLGDSNNTVRLQDFLQTDAAINPGNSGGPLVNMRGEVVGINTAIASNSGGSEGIAFSIPIKMALLVADQLIQYGEVRRAYLGVTLDSSFNQNDALRLGLPRLVGARVAVVQPGSPAAKANFRKDDIILQYNGVEVEDDKHLYNMVNFSPVGKEIPVSVYRDGNKYNISISVVPR